MSSSSITPIQNDDFVLGARQFENPRNIQPQLDTDNPPVAPLSGGARIDISLAHPATMDVSNPARASFLPASASEPDAGYKTIRDKDGNDIGLETSGYGDVVAEKPRSEPAPTPNYSRVVAYPSGHTVAFPDSLTAQEFADAAKASWNFLKNEAVAAGQAIIGLPSAIADSVTVAPTADEQKTLGVPANPSLAQKAALALYRNLGEPIANAAQFYGTLVKHNQSLINAIPTDVLAQGLGAGAGAALLGKVLAPTEESAGAAAQPKVAVSSEPKVEFAQAPHAEVVPTETAQAASMALERRSVARPPLLSATELEEAIRNRRPVRTLVDSTPGAQATIDADIRQRLSDAPSGRNARRAEPVQTVIPGTGVEEVKPEVPDTRPDVPTFYSKAERVTQEKIPNSASGDQILATLRNSGVKENEISWMGLDDFLKGKPKVSKADVQQFIKDNQIQLGEVNRTAAAEGRGAMQTEQNQLHDYLTAVQGRNADSSLGKALTQWLADEGPESTSRLLSHPDMTPELASQVARWDQLEEQLKGTEGKPAKFSKYVLDGPKENYNEKLLTLPENIEPITKFPEGMKILKTSTGEYWVADEDGYDVTRNEYGDQHTFGTPEKAREAALEAMNNGPFAKKYRGLTSQSFKSPHFEEPNVLAHVRHDDRIDTDGKKNLFLEEVQSDWHQAGKQEGYRIPVDTKELPRQLDNANDAYQTVSKRLAANPEDAQAKADAHAAFQETQRLERAYNAAAAQRGVPDAPFKNDWHELVMKRMLREAAEKGYDRLSWTTGDQQAERYDLSKHIGRVTYDPTDNTLQAFNPSGKSILIETVDPDVDELAKYIGQEPAQKLSDQIDDYEPEPSNDSLWDMYSEDYRIKEVPNEEDEDGAPRYGVFSEGYSSREPEETFDSENAAENYIHDQVRFAVENHEHESSELPEISGLDLKVGGEWAQALYDRAIPRFLNKYASKWNAKVGTSELLTANPGTLRFEIVDPSGHVQDAFRNRQGADDAVRGYQESHRGPGKWTVHDTGKTEKAHSIDITPAMKKSIMKEGQPIAKAETPSWQGTALRELGSQEAA